MYKSFGKDLPDSWATDHLFCDSNIFFEDTTAYSWILEYSFGNILITGLGSVKLETIKTVISNDTDLYDPDLYIFLVSLIKPETEGVRYIHEHGRRVLKVKSIVRIYIEIASDLITI